jgi:hypothetical protein
VRRSSTYTGHGRHGSACLGHREVGLGHAVRRSCYGGWLGLMVPDGLDWWLGQGALHEVVNGSRLDHTLGQAGEKSRNGRRG